MPCCMKSGVRAASELVRIGPHPEAAPDGCGIKHRDGLQEPLRDDAELYVAVVGVRAEGVDGLLEGDLDLEAYPVEADDLHRRMPTRRSVP